jgi:hypothetical protein
MVSELEWTNEELEAAVATYRSMLSRELTRAEYSKAEFLRQLRATSLNNRSESSIDFRMRNISHVMEKMGLPRIVGYKPASNVGPKNEARLRQIIEVAADQIEGTDSQPKLGDVVSGSSLLMGVKAVWGPLSSHVLCFGARGAINSKSYFSVAASAARRAVERPFVIAIGGGKEVRDGFEGRVLNVARVATVCGPTSTLVADPAEVIRLAQWPVAVSLHDVWRFVGFPRLVEELGFSDRTILSGSQDGIVRPDEGMNRLWAALCDWPLQAEALPLPGNFYDSGQPKLVITKLPTIPSSAGAEEGERVWRLQLKTERDRALVKQAKLLNLKRFGAITCEACAFSHGDGAMFDAHHPTPLAVGKRTTLPEHLHILCPTCHRRAHRRSNLDPFPLHELQAWVVAGRP